jgi:1,2-diacylglycerol 3-beta-galactosyltransferase
MGFAGGPPPAHAAPLLPLGPSKPQSKRSRGGRRKRVMILMSDTGGGHRASAQALQSAFQHLYGDEYQISIVDLWAEHTPWPYNGMPTQYSFLVKYPVLWRASFHMMAPKFIHEPTLTFTSVMVRAFSAYY